MGVMLCAQQIFKTPICLDNLWLDTAAATPSDWLWNFVLTNWLLRLILTYVHVHTSHLFRSQTQ